MPGISPSAAR